MHRWRGFYLTQFFLSKSIPLLVFIWLVVVLDDPEQNFPAMDPDSKGTSGATVIATMLITQFSKLLLLFIVATLAPLFMQVWLESSLVSALLRVIKQIFTLAPLHFVFQAKVIGNYITNEAAAGTAGIGWGDAARIATSENWEFLFGEVLRRWTEL